jgi:hypothetical protein
VSFQHNIPNIWMVFEFSEKSNIASHFSCLVMNKNQTLGSGHVKAEPKIQNILVYYVTDFTKQKRKEKHFHYHLHLINIPN